MTHFMPSSRTLYLIDGGLALWVVLWIGFGVAIGVNVRNLTILSNRVATDGRAVARGGRVAAVAWRRDAHRGAGLP
jgi:hypothetical protein